MRRSISTQTVCAGRRSDHTGRSAAMTSLVPHPRLLWLVALTVVPAATLAGVTPQGAAAAGGVVLFIGLVALMDALAGRSRLQDISLTAPPVAHGAKGREVELRVALDGLRARTRAGLSLPDVVRCDQPVVSVAPPAGEAVWVLLVLKRGRHLFDHLYVEANSPLGLWQHRRALPLGTELRVYPDLRRERRGLAAVFLNKSAIGFHTRSQIGKGREFDHLREYVAGDDFADIHWKTTARRGFPVTKTYRIERTREVYAVIDHSRLSAREIKQPLEAGVPTEVAHAEGHLTGGDQHVTTRLERALESALILGLAAERQHDLFGFVTFADQVTRFVRSGSGRAHFGICRQALCTLEPRLTSPNFEELFVYLRKTLTRRALLIIMTDLSDPLQAESFVQSLRLVSRQHLVLVSMIRPETAAPLFSHADTASLDDVYRDLGGHFLWHDLQEVGKVLGQQGVTLTLPDSGALATDVVSRYMEVKQRQML